MAEPQLKRRFDLPSDFDSNDRALFGTLAIDQIVKRTLNHLDVNGKRLPNYSKAYSETLEFKIAKKNRSEPNNSLTGDTLNSIQILENGEGFVTIGYQDGTIENDKAQWLQASDNGPARKFLGLTDTEFEQIVSEVRLTKGNVNEAISTTTQDSTVSNILKTMDISFLSEDGNG